MTLRRPRSLQLRLAIRLALVYLLVTLVIVAALAFRAYDVAATLKDRELRLRAMDLARAVEIDDAGAARLALPPSLAEDYASTGEDVFAIRAGDGRVIAARPRAFGEQVADWPLASDEPAWFQVEGVGDASEDYYGLSIETGSQVGPLSIYVAQAGGRHGLVESVVSDFMLDMAWWIPLLVAITLGAGVWAIRSGLKPIRKASDIAAQIGPTTTAVRLPEQNLPDEIAPLVAAMNRALDRLDRGFAVQREFTANAAHELRTPLAILTAALDAMSPTEEVNKLKSDVARMNRLVEQLLRVARLDAVALDVSGSVDLNVAAAAVVAAMAPLAIANCQNIELVASELPTVIIGNRYAVEDAIRNLVENALALSPQGADVEVRVAQPASVSIADHGPGVRTEDRERIFERFWRGKGGASGGAGLGLAIVCEIMRAHGGALSVEENPGGGAIFSLNFSNAN
ncbi:MAG: ATP-binding protein [Hyphomonadaceae bacterium]|nr:ATP-binding protein [Hyphomonadaceae bacterium]